MAERFDVAVIGGGIAGASAAYELSEHGDVVVLEREATCGHHATGRSAAVFTECYGDAVVRRLAIASRRFLSEPPDHFADGPLLTERPLLFVGTDRQRRSLAAALDDFRSMVPSVRRVGADEAAEMCPVLDTAAITGGVLEPHARDLDVHGLHLGYQVAFRRRGGVIRTAAEVTSLRRRGAGWVVTTADSDYLVDTVVNAAGAWCDAVAEMGGVSPVGLVPKRRTAFTFRPPEGMTHRAWPMVIDVEEHWYFKPEGAHLLASPADETPMEPCDVRHDEADVALAIQRIEAVTTLSIRTVDHAWAGLRSFVADHRPVNGWAPDAPGFYWLAGQGGFGIKTAPAMARIAAGLISGNGLPDDLAGSGLTAADLGPLRLGRGGAPLQGG